MYSEELKKLIPDFPKEKMEKLSLLEDEKEGIVHGVIGYLPESMHIVFFAVDSKCDSDALFLKLIEEAEKAYKSRITVFSLNDRKDFYLNLGFEAEGEEESFEESSGVSMEYMLGQKWLGRTVTVTVEHEYGSFHDLQEITYPLNCGYVEEVLKETGEFSEAYVYGISEPVHSFTGIVTALIYHKEDDEIRYVVSPVTLNIDPDEVKKAAGFNEQFYDTKFIFMKKRS